MKKLTLALTFSSAILCSANQENAQKQFEDIYYKAKKQFEDFKNSINAQNIQQVKKYIKEGYNVNVSDTDPWPGTTPLMVAASQGATDIMKILIEAGADVYANSGGSDFPHAGKPVLRYAIDSRSLPAVEMLIQAGADVNQFTECPIIHPKDTRRKANERNLPLLSCAIHSHAPIEIIQAFIKAGADINKKSMFGYWTPLMVAAYDGYTEAAKELLVAGADATAKNSNDNSRTALYYAKENKHVEIANLLQNKEKSSVFDEIKMWFYGWWFW